MSHPPQGAADEDCSAEATRSDPVLLTKLFVPPVRANLVPRPALVARLNRGLDGRLTLVSAPAGFGKTTLIVEWLHQTRWPVAWLSLDAGENDPVRFFTYLLAALEQVDPEIGQAVRPMLQAPQSSPWEPLLTGLINDIARASNPFLLVLDDYHLIETRTIHDALAFLLDHLPPPPGGMHLVIASRADPPLPIARLRARGQLAELHVADLRFSPDEALTFLNEIMGLSLEAGQIAALERRTEGWIAGLQLAARSMQGREDVSGFIQAFTGSHRYVLDYLTEEVFNREPEERQVFLLQTSILDRLTGPLCDAVRFGTAEPPSSSSGTDVRYGLAEPSSRYSGTVIAGRADSQAILESLDAANLFIIPLDEERCWYRYHHLFADLLRRRLQVEQRDLVPTLHKRASAWYEKNGLIPEAASHALSSGDLGRAASLIEWTGWALLARGEMTTLLGWLDRLPGELTRSRPQLGILGAWALALSGALDRIEPYLQDVDREVVPGEVAAIRAYVASHRDDLPRAIALCQRAFERVPQEKWFSRGIVAVILGLAPLSSGDPVAAGRALAEAVRLSQVAGRTYITLIATTMLAEAQEMQGQLCQSVDTYRRALQLATEGSRQPAPSAGMAYVGMAGLLYEWNDLEGAMRCATKGIELSELGGSADTIEDGYLTLARIHRARGKPDTALEMIQEAERLAQRCNHGDRQAEAAELRARLWLGRGSVAEASRWAPATGASSSI